MKREICWTVEQKQDDRWITTYEIHDDAATIYQKLTEDFVAKKLNHCTWIKRMTRQSNYDGTQTITVTYDNGHRSLYTIKEN